MYNSPVPFHKLFPIYFYSIYVIDLLRYFNYDQDALNAILKLIFDLIHKRYFIITIALVLTYLVHQTYEIVICRL